MARQAARVGHIQQQTEPCRGPRPADIEHGQGAFQVSNGVVERQPPDGVGGGVPAVAHRLFTGSGVTGSCRRRKVGG